MSKWEKARDSKGQEIDSLLRDVASGIYYVKKFKAGRTLFRSTGTDNLTLAKDIKIKLLAEFLEGKVVPTKAQRQAEEMGQPPSGKTFSALADEFYEHRVSMNRQPVGTKLHVSKRTLEKDRTELNAVRKLFGNLPVTELTVPYWENWCEKEASKIGRKTQEIRRYLTLLLTFASKRGLIQGVPKLSVIERVDLAATSRNVFTEEEMRRLYQIDDPAVKLQVVFMYECGMRSFEAMRLTWNRIRVKKGITFIDIQNNNPKKPSREIVATETAAKLLTAWKKIAPPSEWVFPSSYEGGTHITSDQRIADWERAIKRLNATAKKGDTIIPAHKTMYWIRHTFYTQAILEDGHNISLVSALGGTSIQTIMRHYTHNRGEHLIALQKERASKIAERTAKKQRKA